MANFAKARRRVIARSHGRRQQEIRDRIMRRRGDRIAMTLLERDDLAPNTNYLMRAPRIDWTRNMRRALADAFRNEEAFDNWDWTARHAWADAMLTWLWGSRSDNNPWTGAATDLGLGVHVTTWRRLGLEIARQTTDRLAEDPPR